MKAATNHVIRMDPLPDGLAETLLDLRDRYGTFGAYSEEGFPTAFAADLAQRHDAAANFVRTGGRFGRRDEPKAMLAARTNYFRETYSYGDEARTDGVEAFRDHEALVHAARELFGRPIVIPAIVYANVLVPGQELALHTDVPEFLGMDRRTVPQWLLVVMHHSGLFEPWRIPIATAVAYAGGGTGGEFAHYLDGADGAPSTVDARHSSAVMLDTDSIFHGVDRVAGDDTAVARMRRDSRLQRDPTSGDWDVIDAEGASITRHAADALRYSVSWKAYCFADDAEHSRWRSKRDDLALGQVLTTLEADLRTRGALDGPLPSTDAEFGRLLIDTYIRFPPAAAPLTSAG